MNIRSNIAFFYVRHKPLLWSLLFLSVYSTALVFAAPPASPYTPQDNITNPTCAPTDTNCFVSVFPDQTSNTGKLLFTDGTSPAWASNLYWDETNDRLGVGTGSPNAALDVYALNNGVSTELMRITSAGSAAGGTGSSIGFYEGGIGAGLYNVARIEALDDSDSTASLRFYTLPVSASVATEKMIIRGNGNVGIGTSIPGEKLEVLGNIISKGTQWTLRSNPVDNLWDSVAYGNGLFVVTGESGTGNRVMTSPDGINWTMRTSASDQRWVSVTYGNGLFVAVSPGGSDNIMTSPDGINWTLVSDPNASSDKDWRAIAYGNGTFVAVGSKATGTDVATSPDGITWTLRTTAANNQWGMITYGNGLFVAVSSTGTGNRVMTSPDGITWTSRTSAADNNWSAITYGNGMFVVVGRSGTGNRIMTSSDGITWTSRTNPADNSWSSVTYGNGLFVAVAFSGTGNRVMTSPDGINWTMRTSAADNDWNSVAYGNGVFVSVASSGTGNRVMTSGKVDYIPFSSNNIFQGNMKVTGVLGLNASTPDAGRAFDFRDTTGGNEQFTGIGGNIRYIRWGGSNSAIRLSGAGGTKTSPTATMNGGGLGSFSMGGYDGSNYRDTFAIDGEATETFTGSGWGSRALFKKVTNGTTVLNIFQYVDEQNQTGFGNFTVAPTLSARLTTLGAGSTSSTYGFKVHNSTGTSNTLVVRDDVRVGIATDSPSHTLTVGNNAISGIVARFENSTGTCDINPTTTSLSCSSDQRLKKNIVSIDSSLSLINNLRPVTYNWNTQSDSDTKIPGFIAQEVETQFPFLVTTDTVTNLKSLNYTLFTPYIIKALQEIDIKITPLTDISTNTPQTLGSLIKSFIENTATVFERIFVREVSTDTLCIGETCVTESDLQHLLQQSNVQSQPVIQNQNIDDIEVVDEPEPSGEISDPQEGDSQVSTEVEPDQPEATE